jgi:hypothetical protein
MNGGGEAFVGPDLNLPMTPTDQAQPLAMPRFIRCPSNVRNCQAAPHALRKSDGAVAVLWAGGKTQQQGLAPTVKSLDREANGRSLRLNEVKIHPQFGHCQAQSKILRYRESPGKPKKQLGVAAYRQVD